jgi:hypothetical protein
MAMPSTRRCGSPSMTARSMNAPGSPSSALQIRYFWSAGVQGELPLRAGGEAAAAAAAQAGALDGVAELGRVSRAGPWPGAGSRRGRCTRRCCRDRSGRSWPAPSASAGRRTDARRGRARPSHASKLCASPGRRTDRFASVLPRPRPRPHVPAPTKMVGRSTTSRRSWAAASRARSGHRRLSSPLTPRPRSTPISSLDNVGRRGPLRLGRELSMLPSFASACCTA